jgi:imidazole glycerol-phosphate synthase subunit HisH
VIVLVDYGAGNLRSVQSGFERAGAGTSVSAAPAAVREAPLAVIAGVGNAQSAARELDRSGLAEALRDRVTAGRALLGICLGMQLLFESSDEGDAECLGLLPGRVTAMGFADRLPHMGWNDVSPATDHPLAAGLPAVCYFAHSYAVQPASAAAVVATTELDGHRFASMVGSDRVAGTQFHPEKSGPAGRELLRSFLRWSGDAA